MTSVNVLGSNSDGDVFPDDADNCPLITNDDQADDDLDGIGNCCDDDFFGFCPPPDSDQDGINDLLITAPAFPIQTRLTTTMMALATRVTPMMTTMVCLILLMRFR